MSRICPLSKSSFFTTRGKGDPPQGCFRLCQKAIEILSFFSMTLAISMSSNDLNVHLSGGAWKLSTPLSYISGAWIFLAQMNKWTPRAINAIAASPKKRFPSNGCLHPRSQSRRIATTAPIHMTRHDDKYTSLSILASLRFPASKSRPLLSIMSFHRWESIRTYEIVSGETSPFPMNKDLSPSSSRRETRIQEPAPKSL